MPAAEPLDRELALRLERIETEVYLDFVRAAPPALAAEHGIRAARLAGASCVAVASQSAARLLNHVIGLGLEREATERDLAAIAAFYGLGRARFAVALSPGARPRDLRERLAARGFVDDYAWAKLVRAADPVPERPIDLRIEIAGAQQAAPVGRLVAAAFELPGGFAAWVGATVGRPPWTWLVALDGATVVGAAAVVVRDGVAQLGFAATDPVARGRGAHASLISGRIRVAAERGATIVASETGMPRDGQPGPSWRNLERAGFEVAYVRPNVLSPPED